MAKNMQIDIDNESNIYPYYQVPNHVQEKLKSGENLKTVNEESLLGQGNMDIGGGGAGVEYITYGDADGRAKIASALEEGKIPVVIRNNGEDVYSYIGIKNSAYTFTKASVDVSVDDYSYTISINTVTCRVDNGTWSNAYSTTLPSTSALTTAAASVRRFGSPVPLKIFDMSQEDYGMVYISLDDIHEYGVPYADGEMRVLDIGVRTYGNGCGGQAIPVIQFTGFDGQRLYPAPMHGGGDRAWDGESPYLYGYTISGSLSEDPVIYTKFACNKNTWLTNAMLASDHTSWGNTEDIGLAFIRITVFESKGILIPGTPFIA